MKRQRGNTGIIYGVLILLIASVGVGVVYTYKEAIERAQKAEADNTALRERNSEFANENANLRLLKQQQDLILAERQGRRAAAADIERKIDATLAKAMQKPEVRAWADSPVPVDVLDGLRVDATRASAKDGRAPAVAKPAAASRSP